MTDVMPTSELVTTVRQYGHDGLTPTEVCIIAEGLERLQAQVDAVREHLTRVKREAMNDIEYRVSDDALDALGGDE